MHCRPHTSTSHPSPTHTHNPTPLTHHHPKTTTRTTDVLEPSSTVREAITLSALLKLPRAMPAADKAARVDGILAELDLLGCQHTLIGDEMLNIKGISGGQRRRVSGALRCTVWVGGWLGGWGE